MEFSPSYIRQRGLCPRVRGSRQRILKHLAKHGSIPAGAGEPALSIWALSCVRVYPRGCGGAPCIKRFPNQTSGLSPRVRGSLPRMCKTRAMRGSIPAGAGEPGRCLRRHD